MNLLRGVSVVAAAFLLSAQTACQSGSGGEGSVRASRPAGIDELAVQALVMEMADEHMATLGEAVHLHLHYPEQDPRTRALVTSFLRNGTGAAIDIATSANPDAALLDMLVLATLQRWSFERHWGAEMKPDPDRYAAALERLRVGEARLKQLAERVMSPENVAELDALILEWQSHNSHRTVVSLVRFDEFLDERRLPTLATRRRAGGLFRAVDNATSEIEQSRLLGERLLWGATRYPFLLGQQTELTVYRLADQPELREATATMQAAQRLSDAATRRLDNLDSELTDAVDEALTKIRAERVEAINQAERALSAVVTSGLEDLEARVQTVRERAIEETFVRFGQEWRASLDELQAREPVLRDILIELRDTIESSGELAVDLTGTVTALDRLAARFDEREAGDREPLDMKDVRDAAVETAEAAKQLTVLLEQANALLDSPKIREPALAFERATSETIDKAFIRGLILVGVLVAGMIAARLIPQRVRAS